VCLHSLESSRSFVGTLKYVFEDVIQASLNKWGPRLTTFYQNSLSLPSSHIYVYIPGLIWGPPAIRVLVPSIISGSPTMADLISRLSLKSVYDLHDWKTSCHKHTYVYIVYIYTDKTNWIWVGGLGGGAHLNSLGNNLHPLKSFEISRNYFKFTELVSNRSRSLDVNRDQSKSFDLILHHSHSAEITWFCLESLAIPLRHLTVFRISWKHLRTQEETQTYIDNNWICAKSVDILRAYLESMLHFVFELDWLPLKSCKDMWNRLKWIEHSWVHLRSF